VNSAVILNGYCAFKIRPND